MKTFSEFLEEAAYQQHSSFSSKDDLFAHHKGNLPDWAFAKNRGSKENPKWGLASKASREKSSNKREEDLKMTTGNLTQRENRKLEAKERLRTERKKELHHATEVERSGAEMRNMSAGERMRRRASDAKQHKYHGDNPRNLVLANKGSAASFKPEQPGFHHSKFHAFERTHKKDLEDVGNTISPMRAFTTLVNQARRRKKRLPELQARMAKAYDKNTGLSSEKPKPKEQTSNSSTPRVRNVSPPRKIGSRNVPPPIRKGVG